MKALAIAVLTLVLLVGMTPWTPVDAVNLPGLVSRWSAEGNANDSVGTNNGTLMNGATFATGKVGQAFKLDGINDHVVVLDSPSLSITGSLTVDAWVNLRAYPAQFAPIVSKWNDMGVNNRGFFLAILPSGHVRFDVSTDGLFATPGPTSGPAAFQSSSNAVVASSVTVPLNTFTHVAGVFDSASRTLRIVINGVESGSIVAPFSTILDTNEPLLIGAGDLGSDQRDFANALLDEVEVYNRVLTASEIQGLYNMPNGDFEVPNAGAGFVTYFAGQTFGGWMVESVSVDHVGALWKAASGLQSVDLNGNGTGGIFRDLSTTPGQSYVLRFAMAGNPGGAPTVKQMEVLWGGVSVDKPTFDVTGRSFSNMGWVERQYTVVATSSVTRLTFRTLIPGVYGPALDNVRVEPLTQVVNIPPVATVALNTGSPKTNDVLTATATKSDPDSSPVQLTFVWKKNGTVMKTTVNGVALTDTYNLSIPGNGDKNDIIVVEVTPYDGTVNGATVTAQAKVANTPPTASVDLNSLSPKTNDVLTATATKSDVDAGDTVTLTFVWKKNGTVMKTTVTATALTDAYDLSVAGNGEKGDLISIEMSFNDGTEDGGMAGTKATIINTQPVATVSLNNTGPKTNDMLTATATKSDADNDGVTLTFVWKVNGITKKTTSAATALTDTFDLSVSGNGDKGQTVTVEVTPNDGTDNGMAASAAATVINTPPVVKTVALTPNSTTAPRTKDVLTATATTSDDDGDAVVLSHVWKKNGAATPGATLSTYDLSMAGNGDKNDTITVEVTPNDGTDNGAMASTSVTVKNTPPVATVKLSNRSPFTNDILTATATKTDDDNDTVTLTYIWKVTHKGTTTTVKTTAGSGSLTDTLDLMVPGNGNKEDTVKVEVTPYDGTDNGLVVSDQAVVTNSPPVAAFKFTLGHTTTTNNVTKPHATDPLEGSRIQFKDLSYDPDPEDTINSWQWNIRGPLTGPNANNNLINVSSTVQSPYFRPPDNGVYTATLTTTSSDGTSTTLTSPTQDLIIITTCSVRREVCQPTTLPDTQRLTVLNNGNIILALRLKVVNTPPKVNALNIEVRSGDGATLFGRFLDHGWLDKHTATFTVDGIATPIQGTVKESNTAIVDTGIVTASLTGTDINNALIAAGKTTLPATLSGILTVMDVDKNSRTGTHASRSDKFTITVRADNSNIGEPNNDLTSFAPPIRTTDSVYFSYIQSLGDIDIFEVKQPNGQLTPGSEVLVTLKGLAADFDLALLSKLPGNSGSQGQFGTATFDVNNLRISGFDDGGFDDGGFDDGGFDDGGFDDGGFDDGGFDDGGFDDGGFDDGGFDDGGFDDGGFFHGGFDDGGFDDGGFDDGGSFQNSSLSTMSNTGVVGSNIGGTDLQLSELGLSNILAQGYTVAGFSANRGPKDEVLLTRIAVPGTQLYVVVVGSNGARSATPYLLQIESSAPKAKVFVGSKLVNPPAPQALLRQDSAAKTLFVTQQERLKALFNMDATAWNALQGKLVTLASHSAVQGDILSLPSGIYDNWDINPTSIDEANNTATQIRSIIQNYIAGKPGIQNVVIVGSDNVVPFRRVPDETVIANERYYLRSSYLKLGSPLFSSVMLGNNLTDDYYVSIKPAAWQGRELYIPELSIGRLVETPQEIAAAADTFLSVNGILSPTTAFVGGYDFFTDGSQVLASNLASGGLAVNNLVNPTWNADALRSSLLGPGAKDINAANAHYTHYAILSAYGFANKQRDIVTSVDVKLAVDALVRRILFTIGCHSGLSVPDPESRTVDPSLGINPALDFAQAMAQQRALYIANTGYGLGDTDGLAGTELLLTYLAKNLVQGDITMGKALVSAKQLYLSSTSPLTVYDEKSSIQATLYGLPMYRVLVSNPSGGGSVPSGSNTLTIADGGATTTIPYNLQPITGANGTYYTANGDTQATAGRPVEPRIVKLLGNTGGDVHGVLLTGGSFTDTSGFDPVINRPTTEWELNPAEPQSALPSFWPSQPGTVNNLTLASGMLQSLIVTPGQFKATTVSGTPVRGIQRLYNNLSLELMRSTSNDWQSPVINSVDFRAVNESTVVVTVNASDPSGISRIVVLRISNGSFSPTSMILNSPLPASGVFTLNVPFASGDTILVEVVDGAGNIATATGKGATFSVIKVDASLIQVHSPGKPVIFRGVISGFDALAKPVQYTLDFGDGTFADGQVNGATFEVQHVYSGAAKSVIAALKVTDVGGGVGNDQVLLMFDSVGDVAAGVSPDADLTGGAAWIDSTNMTIVLGVKGLVSADFQYRVRIDNNDDGAQDLLLRYDGGKATGLPGLTATASGNQVTFTFKLADVGVQSGDRIRLSAETQGGVKAAKGVGIADNMPDTGWTSYTLY